MRNHPYDKLKDHKYEKGIFKSPINQVNNIKLYNWRNDCLPDFIWIALILNYYNREDAFLKLSLIFKGIEDSSFQFDSLQLSYIFSLDKPHQIEFYNIILKYLDIDVLSPLTIVFNQNQLFKEYFTIESFNVEDKLFILGNIVENYGTNKSDGATDVQYIILTFYFLIRKNIYLTEKTSEIGDYLYKYPKTPHENDEMRIYRPTVRSMFGAVQHDIYQHHQEFIRLFWKELLEIGGCNLRYGEYINHFVLDENFIEDVKLEFQKLIIENSETEIEDSRFNVIIGSSVYALKVLNELVECNLRNKVMGRLGLRILIEVYITLKFNQKKEQEEPKIWEEYQEYGIGKYKMILIKAREVNEFENSHLNTELIDALINEQNDEMFLNVEVRYFKKDMRNRANDVGEKELYDLYYDYESNYAHGLWGAVRESAMLKCVNPLHLGHNVPDVQLNHGLADVLPDAIMVFKKLLSFIDDNYSLSEEFISKYEVKK